MLALISTEMIEVGQTVGNYRITAKLGEGGMGVVFGAEHPVIGRRAALKVINPELALSPEVIARFVNEAKVLSQIGNEHIVDVTDFGRTPGGDFYLVLEYLDGEALSDVLERDAPFPPARARVIAAQIADALDASHACGIVHRDLKPENIFLIARGETLDFVKVLDFGLAKLVNADTASVRQTNGGMIMGTPHYMAPEQCEGRSGVDARADVYALGVILFEMLTGQVPFDGETSAEILIKHVTMRPPAARSLVPELPEAIDVILQRALATNRDERFPSMAAFREALVDPASPRAASSASVDGGRELVRCDRPTARLGPAGEAPRAARVRSTFREGAGAFASVPGVSLVPARRRGRAWIGIASAAAAVVALAVARPRIANTEAVEAATTRRPAIVRLTFGSDPSGAEVVGAEGRPRGLTPLTLEVPTSDAEARYLIRKPGFVSKIVALIPNVSSPIFVVLEAEPTSDPPPVAVVPPLTPVAAPRRAPHARAIAARTSAAPVPPGEDDVLAPDFR